MASAAPPPASNPPLSAGSLPPEALIAERYRILRQIGTGRMGRVYAAEHQLLRKKLAIKILHPELLKVPEVTTRFEREAMAAANIGHPNVVAATDFGRLPDGSLFLALEFVEGRTLRSEITGPFAPRRALHIARQIASALSACHALGIVHRDLKPENVMLVTREDDNDFVKVLDFGIARFSDPGSRFNAASITRPSTVFGTPEYMPPEQALGQAVDGRADLFSLGVILFELLMGVRPYDATSTGGVLAQQLSGPPPSLLPQLPESELVVALDRIVRRLLAREPANRFQSADAVLDAFDGCPSDGAVVAPISSKSPAPSPLRSSRPPSPLRSPAPAAKVRSSAPPPSPVRSSLPARPPASPPPPSPPRSSAPASPSRSAPPANASVSPAPGPQRSSPPPSPSAKAAAERQARGLPTYLPGDPLPAFELPREGAAASDAPPPSALAAGNETADDAALTQVALPKVTEDLDAVTRLALPNVAESGDETEAATRLALPSVAPAAAEAPAAAIAAAPAGIPAAAAPAAIPAAPAKALPAGVRARLLAESARARFHEARRVANRGARGLARRADAAYGAAIAFIDARRGRMPSFLQRVPGLVFLAVPTAVFLLLLMILLLRVSGSSRAPAAATKTAQPAASMIEIAPLAVAEPTPSALALNETESTLDAASTDLSAGRDADAMSKLGRLLTQHPSLRSDERFGALLYRGAQSRDKKAEELAFALLEGTMARNGTEVLYRLALDKSVRESVRRGAEKRVQSEAFAAIAPADLVVAVKLRYAEGCEPRHRLLEMAGRVGETRTLELLRELANTNGCGLSGKDDCYPCLRADGALAVAIASIEKRLAR